MNENTGIYLVVWGNIFDFNRVSIYYSISINFKQNSEKRFIKLHEKFTGIQKFSIALKNRQKTLKSILFHTASPNFILFMTLKMESRIPYFSKYSILSTNPVPVVQTQLPVVQTQLPVVQTQLTVVQTQLTVVQTQLPVVPTTSCCPDTTSCCQDTTFCNPDTTSCLPDTTSYCLDTTSYCLDTISCCLKS